MFRSLSLNLINIVGYQTLCLRDVTFIALLAFETVSVTVLPVMLMRCLGLESVFWCCGLSFSLDMAIWAGSMIFGFCIDDVA